MTRTKSTAISPAALAILVASAPMSVVVGTGQNLASATTYVFAEAAAFPEPINLPDAWDSTPSISADGLDLYFTSSRDGWGTYVARRTTLSDPFDAPTRLTNFQHGTVSQDGLSLYANSDSQGGFGAADVFVLSRPNSDSPFGDAQNLGSNVNSSRWERWATISTDELELYFTRSDDFEGSHTELWVATRDDRESAFGAAMPLPPIVNSGSAAAPTLSPDGRTLFFSSSRDGGFGGTDIWAVTRSSPAAEWGNVYNLGPQVNSPLNEWQSSLSADGGTFYFSRSETFALPDSDLWYVSVIPEPSSASLAGIGLATLAGGAVLAGRKTSHFKRTQLT